MTPIDPPPGLLDKVAEAQWNRAMAGDPDTHYPSWSEAQPWDRDWNLDLARAAWDAVVEGLGLEWQRGSGEVPGRNRHGRLVSRWEPKP